MQKNIFVKSSLAVKCFYLLCAILLSAVTSFILTCFIYRLEIISRFSFRLFYLLAVFFSIMLILILNYRKRIGVNITLTLVVFLCAGLFAVEAPPFLGISWDDHIHYGRALVLSQFGNHEVSEADNYLIDTRFKSAAVNGFIVNGEWEKRIDTADRKYVNGNREQIKDYRPCDLLPTEIVYIPSAVFLFMGRHTRMSFSSAFIFGRLGNVFFYCILLYTALKKLKSGKFIIFAVSMFPTVLFLMSTYSYDTWGLVLEILGLSLFAEVMQSKTKKMSYKRALVIGLVMSVGFIAKPVYFPLLLILFNITADKLKSGFRMYQYRLIISAFSVALILYFTLPFLITGVGGNDMRGGNHINSAEQIMYMLGNPIKYIKTMLREILVLWVPLDSFFMINDCLNLSGPDFSEATCFSLVVLFTAFWDKSECDRGFTKLRYKTVTAVSAFVTTGVVATAMYVAFTDVGNTVVLGCQPRYIIPVLLPVLLYLGSYEFNKRFRFMDGDVTDIIVPGLLILYYGLYALWIVMSRCVISFLL